MSKIIPAGMKFRDALLRGYTGRIENKKYIAWIKSLPCDACGAKPPNDPSHLNNRYRGHGTKSPDYFAIPQCRNCHGLYEIDPEIFERAYGAHIENAAIYMLQWIYEQRYLTGKERNEKR